jgi:hypothetical protein
MIGKRWSVVYFLYLLQVGMISQLCSQLLTNCWISMIVGGIVYEVGFVRSWVEASFLKSIHVDRWRLFGEVLSMIPSQIWCLEFDQLMPWVWSILLLSLSLINLTFVKFDALSLINHTIIKFDVLGSFAWPKHLWWLSLSLMTKEYFLHGTF